MKTNKLKKLTALAVSVMIALGAINFAPGLLPNTVYADGETSGACGENLTWSYDDSTGTLTISGEGEMTDYSNSFVIGKQITTAPWSNYCDTIKAVIIENSVTSISARAFQGCTALLSVTIGSGVTYIGPSSLLGYSSAFSYCQKLENITVDENNPVYHSADNCLIETESKTLIAGCKSSIISNDGSVTCIYNDAFRGSGLKSINIPDSITSIGNYAFSDCTVLANLIIPNSVTSIGDYAFSGCTGLANLTVPESVTEIGESAFENVANVIYSGTADGSPWGARAVNGFADGNLIYENSSKVSLLACSVAAEGATAIPDSVTSIGACAFINCTGLTSVTIPDSVTNIGESAFEGCSALAEITIPDSVTSINQAVFRNCYALAEITVPNSVTSIGESAFEGCSTLTEITIPDSVTTIDARAFAYSGLKSIIIPDKVTEIKSGTFGRCENLTEVIIPNSVTSIGDYAFVYSGLKSIIIPDSITSIGEGSFKYCSALTEITIPDSVTKIGEQAFRACTHLRSITIGKGVADIALYVLGYCSELESITVDEDNTVYHSAGNCLIKTETGDLIAGCNNSVIPNDGSVTSLRGEAFSGRTGLTSIVIPEGVTRIAISVFAGCTELKYIVLPVSLNAINSSAFYECIGLTDVYYAGSETETSAPIIGGSSSNNEALINATWHFNSTGPDNPQQEKTPVFESPEGVTLYDDYSAEMPDGRIIEKAIDISVGENGVDFNLTQLTPQQNEGFGAIDYGCVCKFDLSLADPDSAEISEDNPADIFIKKEFIGYSIGSIVIYHYPQSGGRESFTATKNDPRFRIYDGGEYWKITVTSLSPFGIYSLPALNVKASQTVDYKANVTVTATADNVPEGYVLAIYEGNTLRAKGNTTSVSYKAGTMTEGRTFTVKIIDDGNNALKDVEENEIKSNCEVKVNSGFFAKLIAFFKGLFGALPNVEVKP